MAVFIQGCSDSIIVTYPTNGMYPTAGSMVSILIGGTHDDDEERTDTADYILSLQVILTLCICERQSDDRLPKWKWVRHTQLRVVGGVVVTLGQQSCVLPTRTAMN